MRQKPLPEPDEYGMIEMKKPISESELRGQRWMMATVAGAALLLGGGLALRFAVFQNAYLPPPPKTPNTTAPVAKGATLSEDMKDKETRVNGKTGLGYVPAGSGGVSNQAPAPVGASALPRNTGVNASTYVGKGSAIDPSAMPPAASGAYTGSAYGGASSPYASSAPTGGGGSYGGYGSSYSGSASAAGGAPGSSYSSVPAGSAGGYGSSYGGGAGSSGGGYTSGGYGSAAGGTTSGGYGSSAGGYGGAAGSYGGGSSYGSGGSYGPH